MPAHDRIAPFMALMVETEMDQWSSGRRWPRPVSWPAQTLLGLLSEAAREELLSLGSPKEYLPDSVLILEGDDSTEVMALIDGWVKVVVSTEEGGHALLSLCIGGTLSASRQRWMTRGRTGR